ncbi:double-strand break repair helicase AddA [Sulfitobacter sp. D35]|uniref:double-strand break repair helicase AddA n=1 Tax=Sulfitobacter sp. D35 TaxID=3083252 RepID=UPI00296E4B68|nr:double-strand break repair helicase AddA [Sulfitobacter sp. D35]MDW4498089.1 double-strand break repair helicase AddA [Sulfitobacter sp. D35]
MSAPNDASAAQIRAADPAFSTWLSANAGSGKTRVLTDRVARLLLGGVDPRASHKAVDPQHILCLTYTKAAASEMQNRLYKRLGQWAMMSDDALRAALRELGEDGAIPAEKLREARRLFARALETPGGLKIQTIHSFCAALLRRFPLESGVSPQFTEMDDRAAELLRAGIVDRMAEGPDAPLVDGMARHLTDENFGAITASIVRMGDAFDTPLDLADLLGLFGQPASLTEAGIAGSVFPGGERDLLDRFIPTMRAKGGNDGKAAEKLAAIATPGFDDLPVLEDVFLTKSGANAFCAKIGKLPTKPTQDALSADMPAWNAFMQRVEDAREPRLALLAAQKALALHRFAARFLEHYNAAKRDHGWLDFDDLILRTRRLLDDPAVAAWVLYKIDGGIDHILVDEAQDTSPSQWDVIRKLTLEFASGAGARPDVARTIFVVGDKKQSIYSFQGADPLEFDRMEKDFRQRLEAAEQPFQSETLAYSFRSSSAVLRIVDHCFGEASGTGFDPAPQHIAFKHRLPGRVDIWPVVPRQDTPEDGDWTDPVDRPGERHHTVILAERIARQIQELTQTPHYIPADVDGHPGHVRRRIRPGDFLILVQRRSDLFSEIIRACKALNLPIAGSDRLKVGAELAVRDLAALLAFLAVPEDDLSLATALKSPLFGWSEQMLFDLAHARDGYLWQALRGRGAEFTETLAMLQDLLNEVDFRRPYDLIERILTRHEGRARLLARLGAEAEDGIDALLSQALAYERNAVPSLTGFLVWMETDDLEIKRQVDSASDQIRVMTVHGAKGLESPIVILPDTVRRPPQIRDSVVDVGGHPVWATPANERPAAMRDRLDAMRAAEEAERLRLLYVALTRAEKWLILAACGDLPTSGDSWYQAVQRAMDPSGAEEIEVDGEKGKRHAHGDWDALPVVEPEEKVVHPPSLEPFFAAPAPAEPPQRATLSPSDLGGAKALPGDLGEDSEIAKRHGTLVHDLLEHLAARPAPERPGLLAAMAPEDGTAAFDAAGAEAQAVLGDPSLAWIFASGTLAEVPISAELGRHRLHGVIDRLIVEPDRVLAVDFKTNRVVPATPGTCPDGILRQMGAYAHALAQIWPDRRIETGILWTRDASFMALPHDIVSDALQSAPYLDEAPGPS